jgi:predicted deacylase
MALLSWAIDAAVVLDLHSDLEAALHIYTGTALREAVAPLAALLGSQATLYASAAGGEPFDEACSRLWWDLAEHFAHVPIAPACIAATIELRGEADVGYDLAEQDAAAIIDFLALQGIVRLDQVAVPPLLRADTPLEGVERIDAPHAGMLVYLRALGEKLVAGEPLADLIDPASGTTTTLRAGVDGVLFARLSHRYVVRGMNVAKLAGSVPLRSGNLLSL